MFVYFCFANWFWFDLRFCAFKFFFIENIINRLTIVQITSFTMLLKYTPSTTLSRIYLYALIFICDHLWESLLFTRIFLNLSYLWESLFCENLFESLLFYDHLWESIILSLFENKLVYESHHLKQIFYHQSIDILSISYVPILCFCLEFFSFCVWVLFIK